MILPLGSTILFLPQVYYRLVAEMWIGYLKLCHNHSVIGLDNIPSDGPGKLDTGHVAMLCSLLYLLLHIMSGLIVWYHGPVPVDYMGLVAKIYKDKKR